MTCFLIVPSLIVAKQRQVLGRRRNKNPVACELRVNVFQDPAELGRKPVVDEFSSHSQHTCGHVDEQPDGFVVDGQLEQLAWSLIVLVLTTRPL